MQAPDITFHDLSKVKYKNTQYKASAHTQKIKIIHDDLVLGFSGNASSAMRLLEYIKVVEPKSKNELIECLNNNDITEEIEKDPELAVDVLGLLAFENNIQPFKWNSKQKQETACFEENPNSFVIGSGAAHFLDSLTKAKGYKLSNDAKPLDQALMTIGYMFTNNLSNPGNIENHYGGGYELVGHFGKKFEKFSDYSFIVHNVFEYNEEDFRCSFPRLVIKPLYKDDRFVIHREMYDDKGKKNDANIYIMQPMDVNNGEIIKYTYNPECLNSKYQIFLFINKLDDGSLQCFLIISNNQPLVWKNALNKLMKEKRAFAIASRTNDSYKDVLLTAHNLMIKLNQQT